MNRKRFLQSMGILSLAGTILNFRHLKKMVESLDSTELMPVLFLGHGSPMNAIEENEFSRGWRSMGQSIPRPVAILCVSAHWETKGTFVTAMEKPRTIHDFGGFPQELFDVQYNAPGSPSIAKETQSLLTSTEAGLDTQWGLDHGCWSVIKHLYPNADIPVLQLSLDYTKGPEYHYALSKELNALRKKGVLIVGSGNIVHNLGMINWQNPSTGYDWAIHANTLLKKLIMDGDHASIIKYKNLGKEVQLSVPTPEHFLPLLYVLGLKDEKEKVSFFNDKTLMGSISMTSVKVG